MDNETIETTIVMHGREFVLEEPSIGIVIRILNCIGSALVRAESIASRLIKSPTNRVVLFGLLAVLSESDLIKLGSAVLQFESDKEGRKWLKDKGLKVSPILKALMANLALSEDLTQGIADFFDGIEPLAAMLENLLPVTKAAEPEKESENESGLVGSQD